MPTEGDIALNSRLETLYTHGFKDGTPAQGRYFNVVTLDDGTQKVDFELTPRIKITLVFLKAKSDITAVEITKYRFNKKLGWKADETEKITLSPVTLNKILGLIAFLAGLDLASINTRRIRLEDDGLHGIDAATRKKIQTLLSQDDGPALIEELLRSNLISKDIVNVGFRKTQLEIFARLLKEVGFIDEFKSLHNITAPGHEPAWQHFFEHNPWVFGYGLNYIWCNNLPDQKLEQVVSGFDFNRAGKRVDGLLRSAAEISHFVLVEIKTPDAPLVSRNPRPGVWAASHELVDGVAQIQKTVLQFKQKYFEKASLQDEEGRPLGIDVYNVSPKSYLLIGDLGEFRSATGVHRDKYTSFQTFRGSLRDPEVITFDELYARALAIVAHADKASGQST